MGGQKGTKKQWEDQKGTKKQWEDKKERKKQWERKEQWADDNVKRIVVVFVNLIT